MVVQEQSEQFGNANVDTFAKPWIVFLRRIDKYMESKDLYQSELYNALEIAEKSDPEHRSGYPAYEKSERILRLLCKAMETASASTMGTAVSMSQLMDYLYRYPSNAKDA